MFHQPGGWSLHCFSYYYCTSTGISGIKHSSQVPCVRLMSSNGNTHVKGFSTHSGLCHFLGSCAIFLCCHWLVSLYQAHFGHYNITFKFYLYTCLSLSSPQTTLLCKQFLLLLLVLATVAASLINTL